MFFVPSNPDLSLRVMRSDEKAVLQEIEIDARRRYQGLADHEFVATGPAIAPERFEVGTTFVVAHGDRVLGYALTQPMDGLTYLASIAARADASGRGVGAALISSVLKVAREGQTAGVALTTFKTPPWNGPWFRKFGFAPIAAEMIGQGLQTVLDRHAGFLDMSMRETLFKAV
jgi:N-acetylglutamate synthase-like GNAT family acetyltransferase